MTHRTYRPRFAIRTVRNGQVMIFGHIYRCPEEPDSSGRFEGNRYAFGLYWEIVDSDEGYVWQLSDHVEHWGTEAYYKARTREERERLYEVEYQHMTDKDEKGQHVLYWASWHRDKEAEKVAV